MPHILNKPQNKIKQPKMHQNLPPPQWRRVMTYDIAKYSNLSIIAEPLDFVRFGLNSDLRNEFS